MNKKYKSRLYWNNDSYFGCYCFEAKDDYFFNSKRSYSVVSKDFMSTKGFHPEFVYVYNVFILDRHDNISLKRYNNQEKYEYYI